MNKIQKLFLNFEQNCKTFWAKRLKFNGVCQFSDKKTNWLIFRTSVRVWKLKLFSDSILYFIYKMLFKIIKISSVSKFSSFLNIFKILINSFFFFCYYLIYLYSNLSFFESRFYPLQAMLDLETGYLNEEIYKLKKTINNLISNINF